MLVWTLEGASLQKKSQARSGGVLGGLRFVQWGKVNFLVLSRESLVGLHIFCATQGPK